MRHVECNLNLHLYIISHLTACILKMAAYYTFYNDILARLYLFPLYCFENIIQHVESTIYRMNLILLGILIYFLHVQ